jgi:hypothetical protein
MRFNAFSQSEEEGDQEADETAKRERAISREMKLQEKDLKK